MKFVRYSINNSIKYGLVEGNPIQENENFHGAVVKEISSAPWDNYKISNIINCCYLFWNNYPRNIQRTFNKKQ